MARWCANNGCARHRHEIAGTPATCSQCGTAMSGIKPPGARMPITNYQYVPRRLPEMNNDQWTAYQASIVRNRNTHNNRGPAVLNAGGYLYHATSPAVLGNIAQNGLFPRDPSWTPYNPRSRVPRFDASKDGYLSMAKTRAGAGAMGSFVLLRMPISADTANWNFRQVGVSTEVRTTTPIPPELLECSTNGGNTWTRL
jgi:hypothetical protein